jgi:hypothetical protein
VVALFAPDCAKSKSRKEQKTSEKKVINIDVDDDVVFRLFATTITEHEAK